VDRHVAIKSANRSGEKRITEIAEIMAFLTGGGADVVRKLFPEYQADNVEMFEEGSLRGVAKLFSK